MFEREICEFQQISPRLFSNRPCLVHRVELPSTLHIAVLRIYTQTASFWVQSPERMFPESLQTKPASSRDSTFLSDIYTRNMQHFPFHELIYNTHLHDQKICKLRQALGKNTSWINTSSGSPSNSKCPRKFSIPAFFVQLTPRICIEVARNYLSTYTGMSITKLEVLNRAETTNI